MDNLNYKLTIVIPVFNEKESLFKVYSELIAYLRFTQYNTTVLFVDDGSTDGSVEIITSICKENKHFDYCLLNKNSGISTALKVGFDQCKTPYVGYMDADLQTSPKDFMLFFNHLDNYNMVTGIRQKRNDSFIKRMSSKIANNVRRLLINDGIEDTCCPLKIMETSYAKNLYFFKGMHRFLPALIQLQGGKVKQVRVRHFARYAGTPKYHLLNRLWGPFIDTLVFMWMKKRWISYKAHEHSINVIQTSAK